MGRWRKSVVSVAALTMLALVGAGCSSESTSSDEAKQPSATASAPQSSVAPDSEAALRETLDNHYREVAQNRAWDKQWDYNSPRCQAMVGRAELAQILEEANADRDFSGPEEYMITMNGDSAIVVRKSFDGKGQMTPNTWTFINGEWLFDNC